LTESEWGWVLFAFELIGITGMYIVGLRKWWGWAIVLGHSIPWAIYAYTFNKTGFMAMTLMWWIVNTTNMIRWRKQKLST